MEFSEVDEIIGVGVGEVALGVENLKEKKEI